MRGRDELKMSANATNKVALIGCRYIDLYGAFSLVQSEAVDELLLTGDGCDQLADDLCELVRKATAKGNCNIRTGDHTDAANADIAVMGVAIDDFADISPDARSGSTAARLCAIVNSLVNAGFNGIFLVITNPIDVMSNIVRQTSGFPPQRVIGLGTPAECNDLYPIVKLPPVTWCSAGLPRTQAFDNCDPTCQKFQKVLEGKRGSAGCGSGSMKDRSSTLATCVTQVCQIILRDERSIIPIFTFLADESGHNGIYTLRPCLLGRGGVEKIVHLPGITGGQTRMRSFGADLKNADAEILCPVVLCEDRNPDPTKQVQNDEH